MAAEGSAGISVAGHVAERMEGELGISVLRHSDKKPAGGAADLEAYFGCGRNPR